MKDDGMADILNQDSQMTIIFFKRIIHSIRNAFNKKRRYLIQCARCVPGINFI